MTRKTDHPAGTVHTLDLEIERLKDNPLGDPHVRRVDVWTPAGHDGAGLPLLVDLAGYTGSGLSHTNWKNFGENVPERLDRLVGSGAMKPAVVAFPDGFTRLGGNQYVNSAALGPWADVICEDVVPGVESVFGCGGDGRRAVFGKSSGGFGAMHHAMTRPDIWAAAACHSGDMGFELCYAKDFPAALRAIARHGSIKAFMDKFEENPKPSGSDIHVLMTLAMAASYDPCPDGGYLGIRLPVDPHTCERIAERWNNWLAFDPLVMVEEKAEALKSLKALFIDCGDVDQYDLVYGARRLHRRLDQLGVTHRYEEFPDDHSGIDYRMDVSLPYLVEALG
ncbi:MAG: alpha/beta hydrolase-fold protein [Oceanicaulis sp.]